MFSALFDLDNPVFRFFNRLIDLIVLNVIFLISCIPVFTIGTALTSLYYVCINDWDPQNAHIFKKYKKSFKENFKKSTILWLILLAAGVILGIDLWYMLNQWNTSGNNNYRIGIIFCILFIILYLCIFTYVWPLQAKFENKIKNTIQNALGMAIGHLPETIVIWCVAGIAIYCIYQYTIIFALCLILTFSAVAYIQSALFRNVFRPYLELEEDDNVWSHETETEKENRYADAKIEVAEMMATRAAEETQEESEEQMHAEKQPIKDPQAEEDTQATEEDVPKDSESDSTGEESLS